MSEPLSLISSKSFHRGVVLDTAYGPLAVTFADIDCATGPVLLFHRRAGVRLLVVDRPGMGASTDVPLAQRLAVWVDMLPRLLAHLGIPRVSLVSHSARTIYLLNTWAYCCEVVSPVIAFSAPWVNPAHSHVTAMQMAQYIPTKAFAIWHLIPRFFVTQATPALVLSGALVSRVSSWSSGTSNSEAAKDRSFLDANWRRVERDYGVPHAEQAELARLALCFMVSVRTYFSATDALVGSRGQRYFEECWLAPGLDGIDYVSCTVDGTAHDTVVQAVEVWEEIFSSVQ
ncbi:hypothetical protein CNMCM5793_004694 [Aspergillus hiratsukae]|uniref:AB hydrolase-1 domain-containing protein n=1 Tax=Aspergillus hiratsukae TaxID=1194566 RepID=A0A8H6UHY5_9EURO|nr:hypothetical protein CNMCM5793_004694 [Aspergillus hiratsukae]